MTASTSADTQKRWKRLRNVVSFASKLQSLTDACTVLHVESMSNLESLAPNRDGSSLLERVRKPSDRFLDDAQPTREPLKPGGSFLSAALTSIGLGVFSVVPYNMILQGDPGSPLFISFTLHVVVVLINIPKAHRIFNNRTFPLHYHAGIILCSCLFTSLKSDAYVRLPAAVCMLLSNLRMLVGVAVQYVLFRKVYSSSQLVGVAVVTLGIAYAGISMQQVSGKTDSKTSDFGTNFSIGIVEILGASLSLSLASTLIGLANSNFGENVLEQIFIQHLFSIPMVFPSQWDKVGPRIWTWLNQGDYWLLFNLFLSVVSTFGARKAAAATAGRSPNLLMTQLVQTLECFLQLLVTAMLRIPPWPPAGFWVGTVMLVGGTVYYLSCSESPNSKQKYN